MLPVWSPATLMSSHFITTQHNVHFCFTSVANFCFGTLWIDIWQHSSTLCYVYLSLSVPHSPSASEHRGLFPLSMVLGRDLITYLFSLSYSKLLWHCVLLRTQIFSSLLLSAFLPVSSSTSPPLLDIICSLSFSQNSTFELAILSLLSYNLVPHCLCHLIFYLRLPPGQIAAVVCNSLRGSLLRPPPSQTLHRSVSVTQREDLSNFTYGSRMRSSHTPHWLAQLLMIELLNMIYDSFKPFVTI